MSDRRGIRPKALTIGLASIALCCVLGVGIARRGGSQPGIDLRWMAVIVDHRSPILTPVALFFNAAGGGFIASVAAPVLIILCLLAVRRPWGALFFLLASTLTSSATQYLKDLIDRPRPSHMLDAAPSASYPSGHTSNAATIALIAVVLLRAWWAYLGATLWTLLMALSRTYLGVHWLTDTAGGLLLGAGVALVLWAALAEALAREGNSAPARLR